MTEQEIDALANTYADKLWPTDMDGEGWIFQKEEIEGRESCIMDFKAGYKAAMKENEKLKKEVELLEGAVRDISENQCCGCEIATNAVLQTLKELRSKK